MTSFSEPTPASPVSTSMPSNTDARMVFDSPCDADLDSMPSFDGGRRRFCSDCMRSVHNLSAMTRDEAQAFVRRYPGACMSYTRGDDGRLVFRREPTFVPSARLTRRPSPMLAAPILALAGCTSAEPAQTIDDEIVALERDDEPCTFAPYVTTPELDLPCEPEPEPEPERKRKPNNESLDEVGVLGALGNPGHYAGGIGAYEINLPEDPFGSAGSLSRFELASVDVRGADQATIEARLRAEASNLRECIEGGNFNRGSGELVVRFVIDATGAVLGSKARFTTGDATPCVARAIEALSFPEPDAPSASVELRISTQSL